MVTHLLIWKPQGERKLGRTERRWAYNIKTDLRETGRGDANWVEQIEVKKPITAFCDDGDELSCPIT